MTRLAGAQRSIAGVAHLDEGRRSEVIEKMDRAAADVRGRYYLRRTRGPDDHRAKVEAIGF
jgi:hypothetical protein